MGIQLVKILLDTHVFLWMVQNAGRVPVALKEELEDPANDIFYSAVLSWEIATKRAKGKLHFSGSPARIADRIGLIHLPMTAEHCEYASELHPHHSDPFDRLLVAQTQIEGLVLATVDRLMVRYGIRLLTV